MDVTANIRPGSEEETVLQRLRALARNAVKEKLADKDPKSFRALFQELQKIIPATDERRSEGID